MSTELARRMALIEAPAPAAKVSAHHAEYLATIARYRRENAAQSAARGFDAGLNAFYRPADRTDFLADQLAASGCPVIRTSYGFRTMTPAERDAWQAEVEATLEMQVVG